MTESPLWNTSRKDMVGGTPHRGRLWFTIAEGMLSEVFYPRVDLAQLKELNFIIGGGDGFWTDLRGVADYTAEEPQPGIPALTIRHRHDRFCLTSKICADPLRDAVLVDIELEGEESLRPYALLTPRLGESARDHHARCQTAAGLRALVAEHEAFGVALMASADDGGDALAAVNLGQIGESDTWQDFARHGRMTWRNEATGPGCVCLAAALPRRATIAIGFGTTGTAAVTLARAALAVPFKRTWRHYCRVWRDYLATVKAIDAVDKELRPMVARSATVLRLSCDHTFPGARVASLSSPWGNRTHTRGGYHLVWPRDVFEVAGALFALDCKDEALDILCYLISSQCPDGRWLQNQWISGESHWTGIQLDQAAFPVLLARLLADRQMLDDVPVHRMVRAALSFIAREGPVTPEDRWENAAGINAFTLAAVISALIEGAEFLDNPARRFARELADDWNASIEDWLFRTDCPHIRGLQLPGCYVRTVAAAVATGAEDGSGGGDEDAALAPSEQVGVDFIQLVRYGLRSPDDARIKASIAAIDALLKTETPEGPVWHRYTGDAYGEHDDGGSFDGNKGRGRGWPLLVGERGHYALAAGEDPLPYLKAMCRMTGKGGLLPEQVWDSDPIQAHHLFPGKPSGSAMPLVWAHAEFIKLALGRAGGRVVDQPPLVAKRYRGKPQRQWVSWSFRFKRQAAPAGVPVRLLVDATARVRWGCNGWQNVQEIETQDSGLSVHWAELPVAACQPGDVIDFTFRWLASGQWEGQDFHIHITEPG